MPVPAGIEATGRTRRGRSGKNVMKECLVDVLNERDTVLHVLPVALEGAQAGLDEAGCVQQAVRTAAQLRLVPEAEMPGLHARIHVDRGGQLAPVGDVLRVRMEAQRRAEDHIRARAYFLWEQDGSPQTAGEDYWLRACAIEGWNGAG